MRRLLADENVARATIAALRAAGFDVASIAEACPGIADREVLRLGREQGRWLVTFDRDYGDLIYGQGEPAPPGVVYLRLAPADPMEAARVVEAALQCFSRDGYFLAVGREGQLRERALPTHARR